MHEPPTRPINPVHVRTFLAVAKHLSYTRAGDDLFLSQPAVSRQIQQLEGELGVTLFEQLGKSLFLTDAGCALKGEGERLLADLQRVAETVGAYRSPDRGSLRIGAGTTPGLYILPEIVGEFHQRHLEVAIGYTVDGSRAIEQQVLCNELDLGYIGGPPSHAELVGRPLVEDEIVCFVGPSHPLAGRRRIDPKTLAHETWILRSARSATRELFDEWAANAIGEMSRSIEIGCPEGVRSVVAAGLGIGYLSRRAVEGDLKRKRLVRAAVSGLRLQRTIHLIRHCDKHVTPAMGTFIELVQRRCASKANHAG